MKRFRHACVGLLCLAATCLWPQPGQCQTTVGFVSDASWNCFAMNADGTQGASLGAPQFPSWAIHRAHIDLIPGAQWMWIPGVDASSPADLQGAYFTKQFNLPGTPIGGQILIAVDDFAEVVVNGIVAGSMGSVTDIGLAASAQNALKNIDLTPYLVSGLNTITVRAQDGPSAFTGGACDVCNYGQNPAGVVLGGSLQYDAATPVKRASWSELKAHYR